MQTVLTRGGQRLIEQDEEGVVTKTTPFDLIADIEERLGDKANISRMTMDEESFQLFQIVEKILEI